MRTPSEFPGWPSGESRLWSTVAGLGVVAPANTAKRNAGVRLLLDARVGGFDVGVDAILGGSHSTVQVSVSAALLTSFPSEVS